VERGFLKRCLLIENENSIKSAISFFSLLGFLFWVFSSTTSFCGMKVSGRDKARSG